MWYRPIESMTDADYLSRWKSRCVINEAGCWVWQGWTTKNRNIKPGQRGYPWGGYRGTHGRLHRFVLAMEIGPLPKDMVVMHICDNPPCINPNHLRLGTHAENKLDSVRKGRARGPLKRALQGSYP